MNARAVLRRLLSPSSFSSPPSFLQLLSFRYSLVLRTRDGFVLSLLLFFSHMLFLISTRILIPDSHTEKTIVRKDEFIGQVVVSSMDSTDEGGRGNDKLLRALRNLCKLYRTVCLDSHVFNETKGYKVYNYMYIPSFL